MSEPEPSRYAASVHLDTGELMTMSSGPAPTGARSAGCAGGRSVDPVVFRRIRRTGERDPANGGNRARFLPSPVWFSRHCRRGDAVLTGTRRYERSGSRPRPPRRQGGPGQTVNQPR